MSGMAAEFWEPRQKQDVKWREYVTVPNCPFPGGAIVYTEGLFSDNLSSLDCQPSGGGGRS